MLDKTVIDKAVGKKYSDFSDAVKAELQNKMTNHPDAKNYASEYDKIQDMKKLFAKVTANTEE